MASSAPDHLRTPGLISNRPCYEGINLTPEGSSSVKDYPTMNWVHMVSHSTHISQMSPVGVS